MSRRWASTALAATAVLGATLVIAAPAAHTGGPRLCFGEPVTILRGDGDNDIEGTNGRDVIEAGGGQNNIDGRGGNDLICGGNEGDDIFGGTGNDRMNSEGSTDFIAGEQGNDLHKSGGGEDQIDAVQKSTNADEDRVRGGKGNDFLDVLDGEGNDNVNGGQGNVDDCKFDVGDVDKNCELF